MDTNNTEEIDENQGTIDIMLMGITGHGKSATGNSILGRRKFKSRGGQHSVTKESLSACTQFNGKNIKVVDLPGFNDTEAKNIEEASDIFTTALTISFAKLPNGFHAVLLIVSYIHRLTSESLNALHTLVQIVDKEGFEKNGILVITFGDTFKNDYPDETVEEWIQQSENNVYKGLYNSCGGRCVLFNNITKLEDEKNKQRKHLLDKIDIITRSRYKPTFYCQPTEGEMSLAPLGTAAEIMNYESERLNNSSTDEYRKRLPILQDKLRKLLGNRKEIPLNIVERLLEINGIIERCQDINKDVFNKLILISNEIECLINEEEKRKIKQNKSFLFRMKQRIQSKLCASRVWGLAGVNFFVWGVGIAVLVPPVGAAMIAGAAVCGAISMNNLRDANSIASDIPAIEDK